MGEVYGLSHSRRDLKCLIRLPTLPAAKGKRCFNEISNSPEVPTLPHYSDFLRRIQCVASHAYRVNPFSMFHTADSSVESISVVDHNPHHMSGTILLLKCAGYWPTSLILCEGYYYRWRMQNGMRLGEEAGKDVVWSTGHLNHVQHPRRHRPCRP